MSSSDEYPSDIEQAAQEAISALIPEKSKQVYELSYNKLWEWMESKKTTSFCEKVLLAYFSEKSKVFKGSTMWSLYSKLKTMIYVNNNVDIRKYTSLIAFLKRKQVGQVAKKSNTLSKSNFDKFLLEADDKQYLLLKVAFVIGIAGATRKIELLQMSTEDVVDSGQFLTFNIPNTKTYASRQFVITVGAVNGVDLLETLRRYISLRPVHTPHQRFFLGYRNGKFTIQPVGINTFATMPKKIALFLGLDNVDRFTGHCFRRSSTTILAEAGANLIMIKQHGGWKSSAVAEGHIDNSAANKRKIASRIFGSDEGASTSKKVHVLLPTNVSENPIKDSDTVRPNTQNVFDLDTLFDDNTEPALIPTAPTVASATSMSVHTITSSQELVTNNKTVIADTVVSSLPGPSSNRPATGNITGSIFHGCTFNFYAPL